MKLKLLIGGMVAAFLIATAAGTLVGVLALWSYLAATTIPDNLSQGVAIQRDGFAELHAAQEKSIAAAPERRMSQSGLAGVMGGMHVKVTGGDVQEILLPLPQLGDGQAPVCWAISSTPAHAIVECRFRKREDANDVVGARLAGGNRDVQITWSAVVLVASKNMTPNTTPPDPYRAASPCAQSQADEIVKLAAATWPESGKANDFAANMQGHIREMKRKEQPRSLDAVGILRSGENSICTANANLACALMRFKGIACRSLAVVPPISHRLEMHRIVEFHDNGEWFPFDPSSLQADIPAKPWHNIIMARTTVWDEQVAMKPRRGATFGCPYGQEIEILSSGVMLGGPDFFWTIAKPLAEFEVSEEAFRRAAEAWTRSLENGTVTDAQRKATSARGDAELVGHFRKN